MSSLMLVIVYALLVVLPRVINGESLCSASAAKESKTNKQPICAEAPVLDAQGRVSIWSTIESCLEKISDPTLPPCFATGSAATVIGQISLNNLIDINPIANTVTLDMYVRLYWNDPRINMPSLFANATKAQCIEGISLNDIMQQQVTTMQLFKPDIFFVDGTNIYVVGETFKLMPSAPNFIWSRNVVITLAQPNWQFQQYPLDVQTITFRYQSYMYSENCIKLGLKPSPVVFIENTVSKSYNWVSNPMWTYVSSSAVINKFNNSALTSVRTFDEADFFVNMKRISSGTITRFVTPITLMLILTALSFWFPVDQRINMCVTLLLAIAAIYISVIASIPLVGYPTLFDRYLTIMFTLCCVIMILHTIVSLLKKDKYNSVWPLRLLLARAIVFLGRLIFLPVIGATYASYFPMNANVYGGFVSVLVIFSTYILLQEGPAFRRQWRKVVFWLIAKHAKQDAAHGEAGAASSSSSSSSSISTIYETSKDETGINGADSNPPPLSPPKMPFSRRFEYKLEAFVIRNLCGCASKAEIAAAVAAAAFSRGKSIFSRSSAYFSSNPMLHENTKRDDAEVLDVDL